MRHHQDLPPRGSRIPLWRLISGELLWALRQLARAPWVLAGLVLGFTATVAVLHSAAPGPVLDPPWRVLVAIAAGMLLAGAAHGIQHSTRAEPPSGRHTEGQRRPLTAAIIVAGTITFIVLMIWLVVWAITNLN